MADPGAVAEAVWTAWRTGERLTALPDAPRDDAEGMAAQDALRTLAGPAYGWKIAATSAAGQAHAGVTAPLPGPLFTSGRYASGDTLPPHALHMAVAEAEFAFVMGADVPDGADPLPAVAALHVAIELPESRFERFAEVGGPSLLAEGACTHRFVLGPAVDGWREHDLAAAPTELWINGERAATGSGAAVLGDPRTALAWLAAELPRHGHRLRAGDVVTTGITTPHAPVAAGDAVRAEFPGLGSVSATLGR